MEKHDFYAALSEEMLAFNEQDAFNSYVSDLDLPMNDVDICSVVSDPTEDESHFPTHDWNVEKNVRPYCAVCKMEENIRKKSESDNKRTSRSQKTLAYCSHCATFAHTSVNNDSKLQNIPTLQGLTCYEILHSESCSGLWQRTEKRRTVSTKHPVYNFLLEQYNVPKKKGSFQR